MKRVLVPVGTLVLAAILLMAGCAPAAPTPAPTTAPAAPTKAPEAAPAPAKAAEPTRPAAQPAELAKKVGFPTGGKPITIIVPYAAGGSVDIAVRLLAPYLEKELGTQIQVLDKPGASSQVGATELVSSKPDGYTLGIFGIPTIIVTYLDPDRKAQYTRKDFQPVANFFPEAYMVVVRSDSPYKTVDDIRNDAKARPGEVKVGSAGLMTASHLTGLSVEKALGVKFAFVQFDGAAPVGPALLGGHVDVATVTGGSLFSYYKSGQIRSLGIADKEGLKTYPGVKTLEEQGYKAYGTVNWAFIGPAGIPAPIVDVLGSAIKKTLAIPELEKKMEEAGSIPRYMDAAQLAALWTEQEPTTKPLIDEAKSR